MLLLFIGFCLLLILFLLCLLFLRIYITANYSFKDDEQQLSISIQIGRLKIVNKDIPLAQMEEEFSFKDADSKLSNMKSDSWIAKMKKVIEALNTILHHTKLHKLNWSTIVGTGEASSTGVVSGTVWAVKGALIGYFARKFILACNPTIQVNPKFKQEYLQTNLDCMVSIRIGKAIQALMKVKRIMKKG